MNFSCLLRRREVAALLGVTVRCLDRWRHKDPSFPKPVRPAAGAHPLWRAEDIDAHLNRLREKGGMP